MGGAGFAKAEKVVDVKSPVTSGLATEHASPGWSAVKVLSGARILFGLVFLFDGMLKWSLFYLGQMQGVVSFFNFYNYTWVNDHWLVMGALFGLGETLAGVALASGLFQRPAAVAAAVICGSIWAFSGYGGWGMPGYTDPGGDLMLALVFIVLIFAPTAYGLASRFRLRERWSTSSLKHRLLRFLVA